MTDQQQPPQQQGPQINPNEPEFSGPEVQNAFAESYGLTIGPLTFQCLKLRKLAVAQRAHIAQLEAGRGATNEEMGRLIKQHIWFEGRVEELEAQVEDLRGTMPNFEGVAEREATIQAKAEAARIKEAVPVDGSVSS